MYISQNSKTKCYTIEMTPKYSSDGCLFLLFLILHTLVFGSFSFKVLHESQCCVRWITSKVKALSMYVFTIVYICTSLRRVKLNAKRSKWPQNIRQMVIFFFCFSSSTRWFLDLLVSRSCRNLSDVCVELIVDNFLQLKYTVWTFMRRHMSSQNIYHCHHNFTCIHSSSSVFKKAGHACLHNFFDCPKIEVFDQSKTFVYACAPTS